VYPIQARLWTNVPQVILFVDKNVVPARRVGPAAVICESETIYSRFDYFFFFLDRSETCKEFQCENRSPQPPLLPGSPSDLSGKGMDVDVKAESLQVTVWFHSTFRSDNDEELLYRLALFVPAISAVCPTIASREKATPILHEESFRREETCHRLVPVSHVERLDADPSTMETFSGTFRVVVTLYHTALVALMKRCGCTVGFGTDDLQHSNSSHDVTNIGALVRLSASVPCPFIGLSYHDDVHRVCQCTASTRRWYSPWDFGEPSTHIPLSSITTHTHYVSAHLRRTEDFVTLRYL
jgi:hypothetical protein